MVVRAFLTLEEKFSKNSTALEEKVISDVTIQLQEQMTENSRTLKMKLAENSYVLEDRLMPNVEEKPNIPEERIPSLEQNSLRECKT